MKTFTKTVIIVAGLAVLAGCSVQTSDRVNVDTGSIKYVIDRRTDLCFALTASRKATSLDTTGLGLAHVPCSEEVMRLVE